MLDARVNALIGLHALGVATDEEEKLYSEAEEEGIIRHYNTNSYSSLPYLSLMSLTKLKNRIYYYRETHSFW